MVRGDGATGALERIQTVSLGGQGLAMTQSADRRFLYVLSLASLDRHAQAHYTTLRIDPSSGRLEPLGRVPAPAYMVHLSGVAEESGDKPKSDCYVGAEN